MVIIFLHYQALCFKIAIFMLSQNTLSSYKTIRQGIYLWYNLTCSHFRHYRYTVISASNCLHVQHVVHPWNQILYFGFVVIHNYLKCIFLFRCHTKEYLEKERNLYFWLLKNNLLSTNSVPVKFTDINTAKKGLWFFLSSSRSNLGPVDSE